MSIFKEFLELDLTRAAGTGRLEPAFHMDDAVGELANTIDAGLNVIVVGESGVGKTALIHELVRKSIRGEGCRRLKGRRVLQLSFRRRLSALAQPHEIHGEMQKLCGAVRKLRRPPALYIRDIGLVYTLNLESELSALAYAGDVVLIGESTEETASVLLKYEPGLRERFGLVRLQEPDPDHALQIVRAWAGSRRNASFSDEAVQQSVALSHRFLARSKLPRKAVELLTHASSDARNGAVITAAEVVRQLACQHRIPRALVDPALRLDLGGLRSRLQRTVIGQSEAVDAVVDTIGVIKAGLTDVRRPLAALLFTGPTGVGKTLIAHCLATCLFGKRDRLVRFNMADYQSPSDADLLFGCAGARDRAMLRGRLSERLVGHSLGVLLLDEFEKAHPSLHDRFLQLMDEGEFSNATGETISCRSFIIIVTTNAGDAHGTPRDFGFQTGSGGRRTLMDELAAHFRFELLNRFDRVVRFRPLSEADGRAIVVAELRRLLSRQGLKQLGLIVEVERRAIDLLVARGYDVGCGARNLRRVVEQDVAVAIARLLAGGTPPRNARVRIQVCGGRIVAALADPDIGRRELLAGPAYPRYRPAGTRPGQTVSCPA